MNWLTANRDRLAAKTTCRRLTSLRAFAAWAGWGKDMFKDYSPPTPMRGMPHPLPEGIEGVRRMIRATYDERYTAIVALCGLAGMRVAEALASRPSHYDLSTMMVTIRGKGDKVRVVPISEECWEVIQRQFARAYVSNDTEIVGLKDRFARSVVTNLGAKAGLSRRVASHDLRATFATAVYDKTQDARLVQYLLGHASIEQVSVYIGRTENQLREGVSL